MKLIKYIIFSFLLSTLSSCEKFLTTEPVNAVSDENPIYDKGSSETALRAVYRQMGNIGYYGETYVTFGYFPSGDIKNLTTGGSANLVNVNFRTDEVFFNTAWIAIYNTINRANQVISKVPGVNDPLLTPALKNQYIGEAKFIRALAYFDLARAWGGVQLILEPTISLENRPKVKRSTLAETYAQVQKDLEDAEVLLPDVVNRIRATRRTVWALRARLHLYKQEWALAEEYATRLIDKTADYTLVKPFSAWFANNVTASRESIFELQYSVINPNAIRIQMQHSTNGGQYRYAPNDRFVQLLNDPAVSGGRSALIGSVTQSGITNWFGNLYYRKDATDPTYIFRIAEMYLIRAEARAQLNNLSATSGALSDLNQVRDRAGILPSTAAGKDQILLAIENERRIEFAWEAHRWFDLARTGRAKVVLEALDPNTKVSAHEYVFPIPVTQIQLDPNLEQNKDY
ncbi:RagB/SusD family nutrient uptake outer membrane protein [Pedobacter heparinus]|uniref:RagB/SusD domain protein n=1 Tax=Pedobacter heparinus (strain ATCC 13125 / DSM 2366 / CIP 104194 / JCM 7457 / NBRC 12017 / NCIMB 9290 / NRRL B-14731 / HIM 762-3) TaxID=485917 RepID=C6XWZ1_PEDHD|nr:RagB/SusD family nutrient uptake outer membrane protein [Pedobacter heparinus]ACU04285.1 RagB/SusD domain protein [Pedobacter heparinus DSM 2366]